MNEIIEKLLKESTYEILGVKQVDQKKFAELIIAECTGLLFDESERLYAYSSECDDMRHSDDAELCAEKCMDNIKMIEEHLHILIKRAIIQKATQ